MRPIQSDRAETEYPRTLRWPWRPDPLVPFLALLPFLVFLAQASGRAFFSGHDIQYYFYPYHVAGAQMLADGHPPLWNPYAFSGIPLVGDGQTSLFSPPSWLFFIPGLPATLALTWAILIQFSCAALGTYGFARALRLGRAAAFVAAVAYTFGGFMTARIIHLSILGGAALLPAVLLGIERATRPGPHGHRWFAGAAIIVALQLVSGHPQVPVYTMVAVGLYTLVRMVEGWVATGRPRAIIAPPLRVAGIYLLGAALAAIQLVPWVELAQLSPRAANASFKFVFDRSKVGDDWLLFIFPYLFGGMRSGIYGLAEGMPTPIRLWEQSSYVGILPLSLAIVGLVGLVAGWPWRPSRVGTGRAREEARGRWFSLAFLALLLLAGAIMAAGWNTPFANLTYAIPVLGRLRDVERSIVLATFALALLAGFGLQRLIDAGEATATDRWRTGLGLLAAVTFGLPLAIVWLAAQPALPGFLAERGFAFGDDQFLQPDRANTLVPLALATASAVLFLLWGSLPPIPWLRAARPLAAVAIVATDLALFTTSFHSDVDPRLYEQVPPVAAFLKGDPGLYRIATYLGANQLNEPEAQSILAVSWSMDYGIQDINGFNSLQPRRYTDYVFGPDRADVSYGMLGDPYLLTDASPILSSLNVRYLLVPKREEQPYLGPSFRPVWEDDAVRVYENDRAYPRAYFVQTVFTAPDDPTTLQIVTAPGFDGRREALVAGPDVPNLPDLPFSPSEQVAVTAYAPDRLTLSATAGTSRLLVLSEMDFPGWHATIDGQEVPIRRTNYLFRGIIVPPGTHTVELTYRPSSLRLGAIISAATLAILAGILAYGFFRERQGTAPSNPG